MPSLIDATKPEDGAPAAKSDLRAAFQTTKAEIEALQALDVVPAADFGVVADGVTDDGANFANALVTTASNGQSLALPDGTIRLASLQTISLPANSSLNIYGGGRSTLLIDTNFNVQATQGATLNLAADVAVGSSLIEVDDATSLETDDLLEISAPTAVETVYNYPKACVRRVNAISGNLVSIDQPLDFFYTVAESTIVTAHKPANIMIDGVNIRIDATGGQKVGLRRLSGLIQNGTIEGPVAGWQSGFTDGITTVSCDGLTYDNFNFFKLRYGPSIAAGSRRCVIKNCLAKEVRHLDANGWSSDTLFENIRGISTDGIIQSHPSIRNTFRNIIDASDRTAIYGFDIRGLGEVVEDCRSTGTQGIGGNTQRPLLTAAYSFLANNYTRRITRFKSDTAVLAGGEHKTIIIEDCDVPGISIDGNLDVGEIFICPKTKVSGVRSSAGVASGISRANHTQRPELLTIQAFDDFVSDASPTSISAITQASPGVITSTAHGLSNGDIFRVLGLTGMDGLSPDNYQAANATADTVEINDLEGSPVDTTSFAAYVSGGAVTKLKAAKRISRGLNPHVGRFPFAFFRVPQLGDGSAAVTLRIDTETGGLLTQQDRWGEIAIRSRGGSGLTEAKYTYTFSPFPEELPSVVAGASTSIGTASVLSVANVVGHFNTAISNEGGTSALASPSESYWSFDVLSNVTVLDIEIEFKEWIRPNNEFPVIT